jgi:hypothetical protein
VRVEYDGATSHVPHIHCLLAGTAALTVEAIEAAWRDGYTRVGRYDSLRRATKYVTKGMSRDGDSYLVSKRLPPRRLTTAREESDR